MALFSKLKRKLSNKRRTNVAGFRNYRNSQNSSRSRRPISPKLKKSIKAKNKKLSPAKVRFWRWMKIILAVIVSIALIYFFFFSKVFEIQSVEVSSDSDFILDEKSAVSTYLQDYLGDNLILFQSNEHELILLEEHPNLKSIEIDRDLFHSLNIDLKSYTEVANIQVDHENGTTQFFVVNELGIISGAGLTNEYLPTIVMDVTGTDLDIQDLSLIHISEPTRPY